MAPGLLKPARPSVKRMSSHDAKFEEMKGVPTVVVPPEKLAEANSSAHKTAAAMEKAKFRLEEDADVSSGSVTPDEDDLETTDKYAFAFDIDGVLIRGGEPIPEAVEAMKVLNGANEFGIKM